MAVYTTIDDPESYFQVKTYTGNSTDDTAITFDGTNNLQPDLIWFKSRSDAISHVLVDSVRGVTKYLSSEGTAAEATVSDALKSFDSDGFTLDEDATTSSAYVNGTSKTYVAWCWKESATAGFDINIHSGTGSSADVSHNLSATPEVIFTKRRSDTQQWFVYTTKTGSQKALFLDSDGAESSQAAAYDAAPTSSVINYGNDNAVNGSGDTYVAYLWKSVQGFSKVGVSYTGNGNADGTFVYTGFRPAFVMIKGTASSKNWIIYDNKRDGFNVQNDYIYANETNAESAVSHIIDLVSNGFKCRANSSDTNSSGSTYVYMAFAEAPFVNSNGVPCNAR